MMNSNKSFSPLGNDLFGNPIIQRPESPVATKFIMPPFSILDARSGEWQERKRAWLAMGIESEIGRHGKVNNIGDRETWDESIKDSKAVGSLYTTFNEYDEEKGKSGNRGDPGTSVFDPVLCELVYRWFCPPRGQVVDPFAGGSVRGIVASCLGMKYWGCDLSKNQIEANEKQAEEITHDHRPYWVCGDSMDELDRAPQSDLIFSCPPYGDLEKYSDDPRDLSNMEWHTFCAAYRRIILRTVKKMKDNSFACFVVGDFRDIKGFYRNFPMLTTIAFEEQKVHLYNEAILVTSVGTACLRVTKQFNAGRKLCKTHQNVLVFCKGDPREASRKCKDVVDP